MIVRRLEQSEILDALHMVWNVFAKDVAPYYTLEGVENFRQFIRFESIQEKIINGGMRVLGAFEGMELVGTAAVFPSGHITLFFVREDWQKRGAGRTLFGEICRICAEEYRLPSITVNAAPGAAEAFRHLGMRDMSAEQQQGGMRFVPMEMPLVQPKKKGLSLSVKIAIAAAAVIVSTVLLALVFTGIQTFITRTVMESGGYAADEFYGEEYEPDEGLGGDWGDEGVYYDEDDAGDKTEEDADGLKAITPYESEDISYEVTEDTYVHAPDDTKTTAIHFEVYFPQVKGLHKDVQETVNEELKNCAMETVDKLYLNPTEEMKEKVIGAEVPVLMSLVEYKVTYQSPELLSVVFQDYSYEGTQEDFYVGLRTKNIDLKTGKAYEVKDIVNVDGDFVKAWAQGMRNEAGNGRFLSELDESEMEDILNDKALDKMADVYDAEFFMDSEGVEIGLDLKYPAGAKSDLGYAWVTAPFSLNDISKFQTDSDFWKKIER